MRSADEQFKGKAAAERSAQLERDAAARREAEEIDAKTRAAAAAAAAAANGESAYQYMSVIAATANEQTYDAADDEGEGEGAGREEREDADDDDALGAPVTLELQPVERGTQVRLDALSLADATTARAARLWVQLACTRCAEEADVQLSGLHEREAEKKLWCVKCAAMLSASLRPAMLHAHNAILGHVDTAGCTVKDVPKMSLLLLCHCGGEVLIEEVVRGRRHRDSCRSCHAQLVTYLTNVSLHRLAGATGGAARADDDEDEMEQLLKKMRKKNVDQLKGLGVVVGERQRSRDDLATRA